MRTDVKKPVYAFCTKTTCIFGKTETNYFLYYFKDYETFTKWELGRARLYLMKSPNINFVFFDTRAAKKFDRLECELVTKENLMEDNWRKTLIASNKKEKEIEQFFADAKPTEEVINLHLGCWRECKGE